MPPPSLPSKLRAYISRTVTNPLANTVVTFEHEFKRKNILLDLYQYYFYNGYHNIVTERFIRLLISYSLLFLINFLINCINYDKLISLDSQTPPSTGSHSIAIYQYITIEQWFPSNPYLIVCFIIYIIYLLAITLNTISTIQKFWHIKNIYNRYLNITDSKLKFLTWDAIVDTILLRIRTNDVLDTNEINIYTINNKICHQANTIISIMRSNILTIPKMSTFLEWNFIYCIVDPIMQKCNSEGWDNRKVSSGEGRGAYGEGGAANAQLNALKILGLPNNPHTNIDIHLNSHIEHITDGIHPITNTDIYNLNQPLLHGEMNDLEIDATRKNCKANPFNYNLGDIQGGSGTASGSSTGVISNTHQANDMFTSGSILKTPNNFDELLFNTFLNQSVINGEISQCTEYIMNVRYRINLVMFINIICLPFTIPIVLIYFIIKYGEKIYSNTGIVFERVINIRTNWQLRYYNELPDLYKDRLARIQRNMNRIARSYSSIFAQIILRFLIFFVGSIFIIVLVLSFIAGNGFAELAIISGHNVLWFLGVSGTMLILLNKIACYDEDHLLRSEKVTAFETLKEDLVSVNPQLSHIDDREYVVTMVNDIYQYRIYSVLEELFYLVISPYYLWKWMGEITRNSGQILELIAEHHQLGWVPKYSIFTNVTNMELNPHMLLSYKEFKANHRWELGGIYVE
uniref:Autophagy-related protein 9 n=1 Tax=viral metagenome TaxID=1070528 RepID=A0A6C0HLL8_9ZZZZ